MLVAVTFMEIVPPGVVIRVGTESVSEGFVPETEFGVTVHDTLNGQPEVTARFTVVDRVGENVMLSV